MSSNDAEFVHAVETAAPPVFEETLQRFAHGAKGDLVPGNFCLGEKLRLDGLVARNRPSISKLAPASSVVSRAAPWAVDSSSSMKPAGNVHLPQRGSMLRLHSSTLSPSTGMVPTTFIGFS
jgi:hypothetical protein